MQFRILICFRRVLFAFLVALLLGGGPSLGQPIIEDEDITKASKELREILYERYAIRERLKELKEEEKRIQKELLWIDELVKLQKELDRVWQTIELAENNGDQKVIPKLEETAAKLDQKINHHRALAEIRGEQEELREFISNLADEEDNADAQELAKRLKKTDALITELISATKKLHEVYLNGPEAAEGELEDQVEELNDHLDSERELVGLVVDLFEAFEEEEFGRVQKLMERIQGFDNQSTEAEEEPSKVDATVLPIPVTDEAKSVFARVDFHQGVVPLLNKYCLDCHGKDSSSGDLDMEQMIVETPIVVNRRKWINVIEQAKNRVMPPEDELQPSEEDRTKLVLALHNAVYDFDYSNVKNPGYESARRLTHQEYDNTIRDLLGTEIKLAQQFPSDLAGLSGFDNSANTLFIQPLLMERYMGAADEVVSRLLPKDPQTKEQLLARKQIFVEEPRSPSDETRVAKKILTRFLQRAYRRPITQVEQDRVLSQFKMAYSQGVGYHEAIQGIFRATLISPNFLMKMEQRADSNNDHKINDFELANRLSYFLWTSMPDDELFQIAADGQLSKPAVLQAQVDRMLDDEKSATLGTVFAAQWLGSQHLGTRMRLDPIDNPWCTESLMAAMRKETSMFFHALIRDNEPIQRLIDAHYTFLNGELAKLYRIPGVRGDEMRRVTLKTDRRGGIFGHGSLLAVTSFPYRTSPVVRGKWVLDTVLGTPPPPPPPNVSDFSDEIGENDRLTIRQKLEMHRKSPNCYACHSQMDPLGLSLENYDWFGRWREQYGRRRKIDDRGSLPNGTHFEGLAGLKKVVVEQRMDDLVRQLTSKMLSFALGRQLEYYDEPAIRSIIAGVEIDAYRFRALVHHIVQSYPFQYKRNQTN